MSQGLLLKDSPEARFELYCNYSGYGKGTCNILFNTLTDYNKHLKEAHDYSFSLKELPLRPKRRFNTNQQELDNRKNKKCWCGKSKEQWDKNKYGNPQRRGYCSDEHYKHWWIRMDNTAFHRSKFLKTSPRICQKCGIKTNYREMDHIIAIVLGGHPWHENNLQSLCEECHKIKTKSDIGILAWWKRQVKYDIGPIIPNLQLTLEDCCT